MPVSTQHERLVATDSRPNEHPSIDDRGTLGRQDVIEASRVLRNLARHEARNHQKSQKEKKAGKGEVEKTETRPQRILGPH